MLIHRCDWNGCTDDALYAITYQDEKPPVEVCRKHIPWPVTLGIDSCGTTRFRIERLTSA